MSYRNGNRISDIIGEISAAAAEQSQGIGNVNHAVAELDQMTQQNAALVEQSAAAAQNLREQAQTLEQAVSIFRLTPISAPHNTSQPHLGVRAAAPKIAHHTLPSIGSTQA